VHLEYEVPHAPRLVLHGHLRVLDDIPVHQLQLILEGADDVVAVLDGDGLVSQAVGELVRL
jgi:hypothetical protein